MISSRLETPGFARGVVADLALGVGDRALELLADHVRRVEHVDAPCSDAAVVDILLVGSWRSMIRAAVSGRLAVRHDERVAEAAVEAHGDVAGELEVLALVVADRHLVGLVEQDVGRHQHRIGEQPGRDDSRPVATCP